MKQALLFILLITSLPAFGQDTKLIIEPTTVEQSFSVDLSDDKLDLELYTTLKNDGTDTLYLKWERVINDSPVDWWTQVCDNNLCYDPPISTNYNGQNINEPVILEPDSSFTLIFHVLPNQVGGIGSFDLNFSLIESPDEIIETVNFIVNVGNKTSTSDFRKSDIKVFPNPVYDFFEISGGDNYIDEVVVYSLLGNQVATYEAYPGKRYDVSALSDGLYLLTLINHEKGVAKTLRLSKRLYRP